MPTCRGSAPGAVQLRLAGEGAATAIKCTPLCHAWCEDVMAAPVRCLGPHLVCW